MDTRSPKRSRGSESASRAPQRTTIFKGRVALWDNLKFLTIVLVVTGHFADYLTKTSALSQSVRLFIYAFHMPLFIFMSGLFHSDREVTRRCTYLVLSGALLKFVLCVTHILRGGDPMYVFAGGAGIPWFLFVLAVYAALTYLLREQNLKLIFFFAILIGMFAGYDRQVADAHYLSRIVVFYPFYLLGRIIPQQKITEFRRNHRLLTIPALAVLGAWGYACWEYFPQLSFLQNLFMGRYPYAVVFVNYDKINILIGPLFRAGCYLLAFVLIWAFIFITPYYRIKALTYLGGHTINVYFWHAIVMKNANKLYPFRRIIKHGVPEMVVILAIPIVLSIILSTGLFNFPLKQLKDAVYKKGRPIS